MATLKSVKEFALNLWQPSTVGFGPSQPLSPQAPQEALRRMDYQVGRNLLSVPRSAENRVVTYDQMRSLADLYGILRTVIEKRKDELKGLDWLISVKPEYAGRGYENEAKSCQKFWEKPDGDTTFDQWMGAYLEDLFVIDAPCLYKNWTRGGKLASLDIVDGSTILVLVNDRGRIPSPPEMAYEQVVKGMPRTGWTKHEMIYRPYNLRSSGVYGFSHVESIIMDVNIALRRNASFMEWYRSGNMPPALAQAPDTWTAEQITQFQQLFDNLLSGDLSARSRLQFIPGGGGVTLLNQLTFDAVLDEWLARIVCARFGVSPVPYVRMMNRNTAESAQEAAREESLVPLMQYMKAIFDQVIADDMGKPYLQFLWKEGWQYTKEKADIDDQQLERGIMTIDDVRAERGEAPLPDGIGTKPMILMGGNWAPLEDVVTGNYQPGGVGATGGINSPVDYQNLPKLTVEDESEDAEGDDFEMNFRAMKAELDTWERFTLSRLGKKAARPFETKALTPAMAETIQGKLAEVTTSEAVKAVFEDARRNLARRRTPSVNESLSKLEGEYRTRIKEAVEKTRAKLAGAA